MFDVVRWLRHPIMECSSEVFTPANNTQIGPGGKLRSQSVHVEIKKTALKYSVKMRLKLQELIKDFENNVKIRDAGGLDFAFRG